MKISVLNGTIMTVMSIYIPTETKVFYDLNLPWMNTGIENLITAKNEIFKKTF